MTMQQQRKRIGLVDQSSSEIDVVQRRLRPGVLLVLFHRLEHLFVRPAPLSSGSKITTISKMRMPPILYLLPSFTWSSPSR